MLHANLKPSRLIQSLLGNGQLSCYSIYDKSRITDKTVFESYWGKASMPALGPTWHATYLLTPWSRILLEKLTGFQLLKKFPTFYGTWRFITAFTRACHLSLPWASLIQFLPPHSTSLRSILILSSHLCLGLPCGFFPSGFPTKTLYMPLLSPICATCPTHLILLYLITRTTTPHRCADIKLPIM